MTDEKFTFIDDVRSKKKIATGAYHKRTHCGKSGAVKFPSDFMTKKEREAMNGEVKSYKLNDPMTWKEFKAMPDDIKITYIKALREKYNVSNTYIAQMLGVDQTVVSTETRRLGIPSNMVGKRKWDKEGWYAWANGTEKREDAEKCEPAVEEPVEECEDTPNRFTFAEIEKRIVPNVGVLQFTAPADDALETVKKLLGNRMVKLHVQWEEVRNEE